MPSVLFICTGNLYRSPLAAVFFRHLLDSHGLRGWTVDSAGTWTQPGQAAPSDVVEAAARYHVSLDRHVSKLVDVDLLSRFDLILVMERGHKEAMTQEFSSAAQRTFLLSQAVDGLDYDIPDPLISGDNPEALARDLYKMLEKGFSSICALASNL